MASRALACTSSTRKTRRPWRSWRSGTQPAYATPTRCRSWGTDRISSRWWCPPTHARRVRHCASMSDQFDQSYVYYERTGLAPRFSSAWWSAKFYARLLKRLVGAGRVLDFGCGMGNLLRELERGFTAYGVDVSYFGVRAARDNAPASTVWV